jgi:hypothetical protein
MSAQAEAARKALDAIGESSPRLAKTVAEHLDAVEAHADALESTCQTMQAELNAKRAMDNHLKNIYGFSPSKFRFEHFLRGRLNQDGTWDHYCVLCESVGVKIRDGEGRLLRTEFDCQEDCPGVVLGYWEKHNEQL